MVLITTILFLAAFTLCGNYLYVRLTNRKFTKFSVNYIAITVLANVFSLLFFNAIKYFSFDLQYILFESNVIDNILCLMCVVTGVTAISAFKFKKRYPEIGIRKLFCIICLFLSVSFAFEFFVFNFRHYDLITGDYQTKSYTLENVDITGFEKAADGSLSAKENVSSFIEITDINTKLKNVFIDVSSMSREDVNIKIHMTDESNSQYFASPKRQLVNAVPQSNYLPISLNGESSKIKIEFFSDSYYSITINSINFNVDKPVYFNYFRFALFFILLVLIYILRPKSKAYKIKYDLKQTWQRALIAVLLILQISLLLFVCQTSVNESFPDNNYYQMLASSLLEGRTDLGQTPPASLANLENPYDSSQRTDYYLWDTAYYNGNYYLYYGPVPAVLVFAPYYALTGTHLPTHMGVFIFAVGAALALFGIVHTLVKRYFNKLPLPIVLLSFTLLVNSSLLLDLLRRPKFYEVVEMSGLFFVTAGLFFWLNSIKTIQPKINQKHTLIKQGISKKHLFAGSLCMALVAGCRPSLLTVSFLALPIFGGYVYNNFGIKNFVHGKFKFSNITITRRDVTDVLLFISPYVVIGILLMFYNYVRFDSPFDFGNAYQLSIIETTEFKITNFQKLFEHGLYYLFNPPSISLKFPYITEVFPANNTYMGKVFMLGGVLGAFFNFILLFLFFAPKLKLFLPKGLHSSDQKMLKRLVAALVLIALVNLSLVALQGGLMRRYMVDFMWMLLVPAFITFFAIYQYAQKNNLLFFVKRAFLFCFITGMITNLLITMTGENNRFYTTHPDLYYQMEFLFSFWL